MEITFKEKVALVTGGTSGIGEATAKAFAKAGARVAITGRRADRGQAVADQIKESGGEAFFVSTDITDTVQVESMVAQTVKQYGRLDIAFNNAGIEGDLAPLTEQTDDNFDVVMNANVRGVLNSMKFEIPAMLKNGGGSIVNNSSIAGMIGMETLSVYCASKHAVIGLTKCAALECANKGIRINAVCPAAIETDMFSRFTQDDEQNREYFTSLHPIGRVGTVEEVANLVLWLSSDRAGFMVGQSIAVDGGFTVP
ncbi:MAG: SDR family oxidoreductase [Kiritimatiellae bacterium]|nr:SDR family oxidoreductase [Kiritimatiellia bacterium]